MTDDLVGDRPPVPQRAAAMTRRRSGLRCTAAAPRPATRKRRFRHDTLIAVDLFSGFGGLTQGIQQAGFDVIMAANHDEYKVLVHEANHPYAEHWRADLVDPDSADYHSARDLPPADLLCAGVSCVNHSLANSRRAYAEGMSLFSLDDPDYEERVTRSERDRATANCVLHYAAEHHPRLILVECTTQLQSWGNLVPGSRKIGDGTTYRWWLKQFELLGYRHKVLFLNSMFFGVGQSRDRGYWVFWDRSLPAPDLEHRPLTWCPRCSTTVEAIQRWRTGIPPTGTVQYGKQYDYRCPSCQTMIVPPFTASIDAVDLSDVGLRIGDRPLKPYLDKATGKTVMLPLAPATLARAERCLQRFAGVPAVVMPAKAARGVKRKLGQQQEPAVPTAAPTGVADAALSGRRAGRSLPPTPSARIEDPRSSVQLAVGIIPFRQHTTPSNHAEPMPTITTEQLPGLLIADGSAAPPTAAAAPPAAAGERQQTLWPAGDLIVGPAGPPYRGGRRWNDRLVRLQLDDCFFRMLTAREIGRGCGFDVDWNGRPGSFIVWGSSRDQVDGYGAAVTPAVGEWIGKRLRAVVHR